MFVVMPFMHSENVEDQKSSLSLLQGISDYASNDETMTEEQKLKIVENFKFNLKFSQDHFDTI